MISKFNKYFSAIILLSIIQSGYSVGKNKSDYSYKDQNIINQITAIVNNDIITEAQLQQSVSQMTQQILSAQQSTPSNQVLRKQALSILITESIAKQIAKQSNMKISSDEVTSAVENVAKSQNLSMQQLKEYLKTTGISYKSYRKRLELQLLVTKLQQQALAGTIFVSPQEVTSYLDKKEKNNPKTKYTVKHIMLDVKNDNSQENIKKTIEKANKIEQEITDKKITFNQAIKDYSQATDANTGGSLGEMTESELPSIFAEKVINMKQGAIYPAFDSLGSVHILYLEKKQEPKLEQQYTTSYKYQTLKIDITPILSKSQAKAKIHRALTDYYNNKDFNKTIELFSDNNIQQDESEWKNFDKMNPILAKVIAKTQKGKTSKPFEINNSWEVIKVLDFKQENITQQVLDLEATKDIFERKAAVAAQTWMLSIRGQSYVKVLDPSLIALETEI